MDLSIKIDKLRVFINKTLSILSAHESVTVVSDDDDDEEEEGLW